MSKRPFCYKLTNPLASPLGSNYKVLDFTEYEADFLNSSSPDYELTMCLHHVVDTALNDINTSSFQRETIVYVDKARNLLGYLIV